MNPSVILAAIAAIRELLVFVNTTKTTLRMNKELTPEQEAELDRKLEEAFMHAPHWQPRNARED